MVDGLMLPDLAFNRDNLFATYTTIHELAHVWDERAGLQYSIGMAALLHNAKPGHNEDLFNCLFIPITNLKLIEARLACAMMYFQYDPANERAPGAQVPYVARSDTTFPVLEDWADAVAYTVYPEYGVNRKHNEVRFIRKTYVEMMIEGIH